MRFYTYTAPVHATWYNALQGAIVHLHITLDYRKDRRQDSVKLRKVHVHKTKKRGIHLTNRYMRLATYIIMPKWLLVKEKRSFVLLSCINCTRESWQEEVRTRRTRLCLVSPQLFCDYIKSCVHLPFCHKCFLVQIGKKET